MNNVQDGTWHGRGDTIHIGSYSEGSKAFFELNPPPVTIQCRPEPCSMQKSTDVESFNTTCERRCCHA